MSGLAVRAIDFDNAREVDLANVMMGRLARAVEELELLDLIDDDGMRAIGRRASISQSTRDDFTGQ